MASTADSIDPCPVMMATSARGSISLIFRSKSVPERLGSFKSVTTISGGAVSTDTSAASAVSASAQTKIQALADRHAQAADALFVIHDQKAKSRLFLHGFPMVFSTAARSSWTRKGFSTHGVPSCASKAMVSALAVSPVINTIRAASSGRCRRTQSCRSAPLIPPGVRKSEITPRKSFVASNRKPSAADGDGTTSYPRRSSAVRRNAATDGSSSITRIRGLACVAALFAAVMARSPSPAIRLLAPPPEAAPQTCSRCRPHCFARRFRLDARE